MTSGQGAGKNSGRQSRGRSLLLIARGGAVELGTSRSRHRLGCLPLKMTSDSGCSSRTWQGRDGWGCSGKGRSARLGGGVQCGAGSGHGSQLPQPSVPPARQHRRDPIPLAKG